MQNVRLLLLGHERFIQREFFEQSYAAPVSPAGKYRNAGKAQGIQIPLDGSDGDGAMLSQFFRCAAWAAHEQKNDLKKAFNVHEKLLKTSPPRQKLCSGLRSNAFQ